jgi:hypothetical protein
MQYRTLVVYFGTLLVVSALAASLASAEPHLFEDPPFSLELRDGSVLRITSVEIQTGIDGRQMFIYRTVDGAEGYKWQDQIANFEQLMSIIAPAPRSVSPEPPQESTEDDPAQESAVADSAEIETAPPASENRSAPSDVLARCQQQWGSEKGMFEDCVEQQAAAARWIQEEYGGGNELSKAEYRIVNGCAKKWSDQIDEQNNYDYASIKDCIEQEMQAYTGTQ